MAPHRVPMGSPPRRRGRPLAGLPDSEGRGLTPAQAGTAWRTSPQPGMPAAHPRAGGDGARIVPDVPSRKGSPPRRRGRLGLDADGGAERGLTPAQAGTALLRRSSWRLSRAHPRAGGDGTGGLLAGGFWRGSPPRRRGRLPDQAVHRDVRGLTPAQAGTATSSRRPSSSAWAHPRAGGDGSVSWAASVRNGGSPPRRRGRRRDGSYEGSASGLTPAQAGTAPALPQHLGLPRAHPRAGGDGTWQSTMVQPTAGSPPRRRGRPS